MGASLILDGHSRAAIESTQGLGRAGIEVFVASEWPDAITFHSRYAVKKLTQPPVIPADEMTRWLEELDTQNRLDLIIPSTENALQALLEIPENHRLYQIAVLPSKHSLQIALDKNLTLELALRLNISAPATRIFNNIADISECPKFPAVLKPMRSKLAEGEELKTFQPAIVQNEAVWRSVLLDWVPRMTVLEQEYVPGWGVGIEMLYQRGKLEWYFAHERLHEWPLTGGASTYRRAIEPDPAMLEDSRRLLDALGWHGVAMVEFKRRQDGSYALMEVNPRLWGSLALSIASGVNFPLGLWQISTGKQLPSQPSYRRGLRVRHLSSDLQWLKANLVADRRNPLLLTRPRALSFLELGLPLLGREHWDHFDWRDSRPALYEIKQLFRTAGRSTRHRWKVNRLFRQRRKLKYSVTAHVNAIGDKRKPSLLFVCQANICRSPFAAAVATRNMPGFEIQSAGLDRRTGRHTPPNVAEEAKRMGFDMSACASTTLTEKHLRNADLILVMEFAHFDQIANQYPESARRLIPLGLFAQKPAVDIEDPNRKDAATTKRVLEQIAGAIDGLAQAIKQNAQGTPE